MANVIREDVVQVTWDIDQSGISQLNNEIDQLKAGVTGNIDSGLKDIAGGFDELKKAAGGDFDSGLEEMKNTAKGANKGLEDIKTTADKIKPKGIKQFISHLKDTDTKAGKAFATLKKMASVGFEKLTSGLKKVASGLGTITKKAGGLALKGVGVAAAGVGAIVGSSVKSFADYEQLVGGVETLFGSAAGTVQNYAKDAFKTAGVSANTYMETVTSFSASLISSCGKDTSKAAELSNIAMTDMADNANKMGTDMETVMGTYQSLAKGNYAMLDNLKLGYGGTKSEMQRLIKEASKLDKGVKANDMSFGNMVKAINAVQKNMGISGITYKEYTELVESGKMTQEEAFKLLGTTAKEANFTITGSFNQMKAAWSNMLTAFVSGGDDFDQYIANLIESAEIFAGNLMPALEGALKGVGAFVEKIAPMIADKLPTLITTLLPPLVKAAATLVSSLIVALPDIVKSLIPAVKQALKDIASAIYEGFTGKQMSGEQLENLSNNIDKLFKVAKIAIPVVIGFVAAFKTFSAIKSAVSGIKSFASGISTITQKVSGGLGSKMSEVAGGMNKTGAAAKTNSANMLASAKAFLMLAASVLLIAIGFGVLAFSAIALANSGGLAIGVMFGLVVALAALGFGMGLLLKSISTMGPQAIPAAGAMMMLGGAVILIAAGFALLAFSAISLANAGGAAIAVMFGLIAVIALLAVGAALLGTALTAGAIGFIAFGAAILLAGVGALLLAVSFQIIATAIISVVTVGLQGAAIIVALGVSLLAFAPGALAAGAAAIVLGAGMLIAAVGLMAAMVPIVAIAAAILIIGVSATAAALSMKILIATLPAVAKAMTAAIIPFGLFAPVAAATALAVTPLAAAFAILAATSMIILGAFIGIAAAAMLTQLGFAMLATSVPAFVSAIMPLPAIFALLTPHITQFAVIVMPLSLAFVALAAAAIAFTVAMAALTAIFAVLTGLVTILVTSLNTMPVTLTMISALVPVIAASLTQLGTSMITIVPQVVAFATALMPLSVSLLAVMPILTLFTVAMAALMAIFVVLSPLSVMFVSAMMMLVPACVSLSQTVPIFAKAIKPLAKEFLKLVVPAGALAAALAPLAVEFATLAGSSVLLLAAMTGLAATTTILVTNFMLLMMLSNSLITPFNMLSTQAIQLSTKLPVLAVALTSLINPLTVVAMHFMKFAGAATITSGAASIIVAAFRNMSSVGMAAGNAIIVLIANLVMLQSGINICATIFNASLNTMFEAIKKNGTNMVNSLTLTLMMIRLLIMSTNLTTAGMQLINGLIVGMNSKKAAAVSTARSIALAINREFDKIQDINSPSGVWESKGEFLLKGGIKGMQNMLPKFQSTVQQVGEISTPYMGNYTPENSTYSYSRSSNVETNHYSPQFNLTISGSNEDRATERKIKRWIGEAMDDMFDSLSRKSPRVQEV